MTDEASAEIKVVLADNPDDPMMVLRDSLKNHGLQVAICASGFDALDEILNSGCSILVMSEKLPDIGGFQLSCLLKSTSITKSLPIVVVSGADSDETFWKRASLADSVLQRKHVEFNEDDSVKLIMKLAEAAQEVPTPDKIEDQPVLAGQFGSSDLVKSYGELLSGLLAERLVRHFCRQMSAVVHDRNEFTTLYLEFASALFKPDFTGIIVNTPTGPWSVYHMSRSIKSGIIQTLVANALSQLDLAGEVTSAAYGEPTDEKKGAALKKGKLLVVSAPDGTKLGAMIFGWTSDKDIDSVLKSALEHLRDQMEAVLQLMLANDRLNYLQDQAQYWSTVDPITGLYNMEFFMGFLQQQLMFSLRQKLPVGLLIVDVDNFVGINTEYGAEIGNLVLRTLSEKVSKVIRSSDLIARYGGDQFAVVLPNTDMQGSKILAEKLKKEAASVTWGDGKSGITITTGCAQLNFKDPTPEAILKAAKDALMRAKEKGRNCISE